MHLMPSEESIVDIAYNHGLSSFAYCSFFAQNIALQRLSESKVRAAFESHKIQYMQYLIAQGCSAFKIRTTRELLDNKTKRDAFIADLCKKHS